MSIFDRMSEEELQRRLMQPEQATTYNMEQQAPRDPYSAESYGVTRDTGPMMPKAPKDDPWRQWIGDPSGFANAGMQAPQQEDSLLKLKGLMSLGSQPEPRQRRPQKQGGLMSYLANLGAM